MKELESIALPAVNRRSFLGLAAGTAAIAAVGGLSGGAAHAASPLGTFARVPAAAPAGKANGKTYGAKTPFVTLEAERGKLGGKAKVLRIRPGKQPPTEPTPAIEASGYGLVELRHVGDSVTVKNSTGITANTLVIRASIPDGENATLNLYVDGTFRQKIEISSAQMWNYIDPESGKKTKDSTKGWRALHFFNEFPVWVKGAAIGRHSTITLKKDKSNTATYYQIDCIDFENVKKPLARPKNSLSVLDFGADPAFGTDSTRAIQTAVDEARAQDRILWIPAGKYKTNSLESTAIDFTGVTVQGAGMWHTILYRAVPLPTTSAYASEVIVGSGTKLYDLQIDSSGVLRRGEDGGADYSINSNGRDGWWVQRVWTRHGDANWLSGSNSTIMDCRTSDSYGDGFNVNNSNVNNPDKRGHNIVVKNNFARGTGDDGFAVYSDSGSEMSPQVDRVKLLNNTVVAVWWANGIRIAGGSNIEVAGNYVQGISSDSAMEVGIYGTTGNPLTDVHVHDNLFDGGGGWNGENRGSVQLTSPAPGSVFEGATSVVTIENNIFRGSLQDGIVIPPHHHDTTLRGNTVEGAAGIGFRVRAGVSGKGVFVGNKVIKPAVKLPQFSNEAPHTYKVTLEKNTWK